MPRGEIGRRHGHALPAPSSPLRPAAGTEGSQGTENPSQSSPTSPRPGFPASHGPALPVWSSPDALSCLCFKGCHPIIGDQYALGHLFSLGGATGSVCPALPEGSLAGRRGLESEFSRLNLQSRVTCNPAFHRCPRRIASPQALPHPARAACSGPKGSASSGSLAGSSFRVPLAPQSLAQFKPVYHTGLHSAALTSAMPVRAVGHGG